ncbi:carbohydrate ABC transporter permease, partial [Romboutsia ilealis]|nr:carbohydrate ABC transporter permease [Romboutsia ilealis]
PKTPMWSNYIDAWQGARMSRYFLNSIIQAGITVIVLGILSSMAAFVLSRFRLRISKGVMLFFLIGMMVPMHTVLVPISYMIGKLNLSD